MQQNLSYQNVGSSCFHSLVCIHDLDKMLTECYCLLEKMLCMDVPDCGNIEHHTDIKLTMQFPVRNTVLYKIKYNFLVATCTQPSQIIFNHTKKRCLPDHKNLTFRYKYCHWEKYHLNRETPAFQTHSFSLSLIRRLLQALTLMLQPEDIETYSESRSRH